MLKLFGKWLKIYEDEIGLFLWAALLLFLIRSSGIIFNNFAETAFLKRFGVEYLPIVTMINSISTFIIMGFMTGIMGRIEGSRLLAYVLIFCGTTVAALRLVVPFGFSLLYPILFVLKTQYETLFALLFWNLANDLFNTRQSKRIFPLITAGGVVGGIIGSFGTPFLAKAISMDNLMVAYLVTTVLGAITVKGMGSRYPTLLLSEKKKKKGSSRFAVVEEFKKVIPMIKESTLVKILLLLVFLPNVVIPIFNYQFNFAIDETFANERTMLLFFGYFRGVLNIISLIILLFVGRIYGRWGLPIALMFHPINYVIAFLAFLFRFDLFSAMYARISTNVLRTTINNPARSVLMGIFPPSYRGVIRPFLRGTVTRVAILSGAGFIILSDGVFHPRFLSVIALIFVAGWIVTTFYLKRTYAKILLDLVSRNMLDLKSFEEDDLGEIFRDNQVRSQMIESFLSSKGADCLWYASLLKSFGVKDLDTLILSVVKDQEDKTKIDLLSLLSTDAKDDAIEVFKELLDPEKPDLLVAISKAASRIPTETSREFLRNIYSSGQNSKAKAYALIGLYNQAPEKYREIINTWLDSENSEIQIAGTLSAGGSKDISFIRRLYIMLEKDPDRSIIPYILKALRELEAPDMKNIVLPYLSHPYLPVRLAALDVFDIENDDDLRRLIALMGDPSDQVHDMAKARLESSAYQNAQVLVESLVIPRRKVREGVFDLLDSLSIKDIDVYRFARSQLELNYKNLSAVKSLREFPESEKRDLLIEHLEQSGLVRLENIIRVLAAQDSSGQMRTIKRGLSSSDSRQRSNSLEALDSLMDASLSAILMPLMEDVPVSQCLAVGKKNFQTPVFDSNVEGLYSGLLGDGDWVTLILSLSLGEDDDFKRLDSDIIEKLTHSENSYVRLMANTTLDGSQALLKEEGSVENEISITDKIFHLRGIEIFEGLSVSELAAIASVTEESLTQPGDIVIKEGESGETMYLIIDGEVSILKGHGGDQEMELDRVGAGDYFGEMALIEDMVRSATVRAEEESRFLVLNKEEFKEIVREYPEIALQICRVLGRRIRNLHEKMRG